MLDNAPSWQQYLVKEFEQPYMRELKAFLRSEKDQKKRIYPHSSNWFKALELTPLPEVKVVILGQDPYHQFGQAHGLCFSVQLGTKLPPSLVNIYKELSADLAIEPARHGCLTHWAEQGVLLLNAVLTVQDSCPNSHQNRGWEQFTDKIIQVVNERCEHVVFLLWGSYAQKKAKAIDPQCHLLLKAPHPSPLSAHRGFFGCRHFSQANQFLAQHAIEPINWQLPRNNN